VKQRAEQHRGRIHELKARYTDRTISAPEDFTDTGVVRPKSATGKIAAEVEGLIREDNFDAMINGAQGRVNLGGGSTTSAPRRPDPRPAPGDGACGSGGGGEVDDLGCRRSQAPPRTG
jgi:hypothetical protein